MVVAKRSGLVSLMLTAGFLAACGGGGGGGDSVPASAGATSSASSAASSASSTTSSTSTSSASTSSASSAASSGTGGATGWASVSAAYYVGASSSAASGATTGGEGASASRTYTVSNRNQLIQAFYANGATINEDGSFSGTLDPSPKIIYVSGTISLNMNKALTELSANDYLVAGSCGYTNEASLWPAYYAAYAPAVWNTSLVPPASSGGKYLPNALPKTSGTPEYARDCGYKKQKAVVQIPVPSNTSIIGIGSDAKIIHGNLVIGASSDAPANNVVIRNIGFEDAFDFFPAWDPTDSFPSITSTTQAADSSGCAYGTPTFCVGGRWNAQYDNISVQYATHVWIDHCNFSDGSRLDHDYPVVSSWYFGSSSNPIAQQPEQHVQHHDGLVDVTKIASYVTLSYNRFFNHDKSFNLGGGDTPSTTGENPSVLKITFNNNHFKDLRQRQARMRYGMIHMYNNYYEGTLDSTAAYPWLVAWTVGQSSKAYMENNAFVIGSTGTAAAASNLFGVSLTSSAIKKCTDLGYTSAECGTSFYDTGTLLNGAAVTVGPAVSAYSSSVVNAAYWKPSDYYRYSPADASTLAGSVPASAGVGKL